LSQPVFINAGRLTNTQTIICNSAKNLFGFGPVLKYISFPFFYIFAYQNELI
jgi:hypothetical protein